MLSKVMYPSMMSVMTMEVVYPYVSVDSDKRAK